MGDRRKEIKLTVVVIILFVLMAPGLALAYIGPGAGFALLSSLLALFISFFLAFFTLLTLPFRLVFRLIRRRKAFTKSSVDRVIVLGFDGLDPDLCERYLSAGKLTHFARLKERGCFKKLGTTYPALSPVAWSTFATGVNPARHNIFDFLIRNPQTYLPELASSRVGSAKRVLRLFKYSIPIGKPTIQFMRKSKSFWKVLGEHGIFSHIIRVPITFPPEKFHGAMLSAMCTPDIRGTQGTFSFYTTHKEEALQYTGGTHIPFTRKGDKLYGELIGPDNFIKKSTDPIKHSFELTIVPGIKEARLKIARNIYAIKEKEFTPWIKITFNAGLGIKIRGICQFYLKSITPEVELYVSPINIDPERPALPISHPYFYSVCLAKLFGSYGSLGLVEDTWALNEHVLDEEAFLKQTYRIQEEREKQFFHALRRTKKGVCVCVFDATDRIQHMFFRYLVDDHPANRDKDPDKYKNTIEDIYQRADDLLGRVMDQISDDTVLIVMSDHGFKPFIREINLNSWLHQNGYLTLRNGEQKSDYLQNVDWENTKAYAIGLAGIYINQKGRERAGVVNPGEEARKLKNDIIGKLSGLSDPDSGKIAINKAYDSSEIYSGPYIGEAPDMIIGYNDGYRISWDAAIGKTTEHIFGDNTKNWSGDHGLDPEIVQGILFCNHPIETENPNIADMAPTILRLFGVNVPSYIDGRPLSIENFGLDDKDENVKNDMKDVKHES